MKDSIPRLVIRCDSYEACGYGHLARCLEVAIHLNKYKNFNIAFVGHFDLFSKYSLNAHNLNFMDSPPQGIYNWEFLDLFELGSIDMILVDSYNIDQHFINQGVKIHNKVIYFDDFCNLDFVNTFAVFNSRIGAEILYRYHSRNIFLGAKYLIIQKKFLEVRKIKLADKIKDIKKILIFVGGADIYNIGLDLVRDVQYVYPNADLVYVYANADESKSTEKLKIMKPTISIENILSGSDLVICGGGRIKYEACYSGLTVATIAQSDGQFEDSQYICNLNLAMDLGLAKVYSSKLVQERLETLKSFEFREQMLKNSGELFHSFSTDLCVKEIINLYKYKV